MRKRNEYIDIAKGIAIILVVLGHSIQYGSYKNINDSFFEDPIFIAIYSFHMPFFMLISGFLFYNTTCYYPWKVNLLYRFKKIIIPIFTWNTVYLIFYNCINSNSPMTFYKIILSYTSNIWFLWAIFYCNIILLVIQRFFNDKVILYVIIGLLLLCLPNIRNLPLYIYMYPFFTLGYWVNKFKAYFPFRKVTSPQIIISLIVFLLIFFILYEQYTKEDFVYISGTAIIKDFGQLHPRFDIHQLYIDSFRILIGLVGSLFLFLLIRILYQQKWTRKLLYPLSIIGQRSLGSYITSTLFVNEFILPILPNRDHFYYPHVIVETTITVFICYYITLFLEKNQFTRKNMLGGH